MIKNPAFFFSFTWLTILWMYGKRYALVLEPIKTETFLFIILSVFFFTLPFFLLLRYSPGLSSHKKYLHDRIDNRIKTLFYFWLFFTVIEIIVFRSLPILSFCGLGGRYTEWGIPSLHGLLNAIILTISNILFYKYLLIKKKHFLLLFFLCLCWPVLLLTRQLIISIILQAALIYIYINKIKVSKIMTYCFWGSMVIFLFGLLGDLRSGIGAIENLAGVSDQYPSFLPSGFFWVYVYITSPLSNLNHNIFLYPAINFEPLAAFSGLLPSVIRSKLTTSTNNEFSLVNDNLNVSTMHPQYLEAFGYLGSLFFYFLYGTLVLSIYVKFKAKDNVKWLFMLSVLTHNLILSIFIDFNLNIVFLFQFFIHYCLGSNFSLKRNKLYGRY